jgi:hypothetical protein
LSFIKNRLLGRNNNGNNSKEQVQADDAQLAGLANTQAYTRKQSNPQEDEDIQNKGIDFDMINAKQAVEELKNLAHYTYFELQEKIEKDAAGKIIYDVVPAIDDFGKTIYQDEAIDANGAVLIMKKAVMVQMPRTSKESVVRDGHRLWASAALVYLDTVMPTIWMGSYEADTAKMYVRTAFHDIRKQMRHDNSLTFEQKQNCVLLLRAARDLALFRCEDTKEGRKPLLLKVRREELGVHMTKGTPNVKGK